MLPLHLTMFYKCRGFPCSVFLLSGETLNNDDKLWDNLLNPNYFNVIVMYLAFPKGLCLNIHSLQSSLTWICTIITPQQTNVVIMFPVCGAGSLYL